ncbi:MAG: GNAT family N-acetyltransferase [bacterium]
MSEQYYLECIEDIHSFRKHRDEWDRFVRAHHCEPYNRTTDWLCCWWDSYAKDKRVFIYIVRDGKQGQILACLPLVVSRQNFSGFPVAIVEILGKGIGNEDFPLTNAGTEYLDAIFYDLGKRTRWHVVRFSHLRKGAAVDALLRFVQGNQHNFEQWTVGNVCVKLQGNFDDYYRNRSRNFKKNLRHYRNRLKNEGEYRFERYSFCANTDEIFGKAKKIAERSWQHRNGTGHFNSNGGRSFMENLFELWSGHNFGQEYSFLTVNDKSIAYLFGIKCGTVYHAIDVAYDVDYSKYSPGRLLYAEVIKNVHKEPQIEIFDFGGGTGYHRDYGNFSYQVINLVFYRKDLWSELVYRARKSDMLDRIKKFVK